MEVVAEVQNLSKIYRKPGAGVEVAALNNVSIKFYRNQFTAIMGASGSGKSTLMNILGCLDQPTEGKYILGGQDVSAVHDDELSEIRSKSIGFIFQNFNLIQQLTVLENLEVPMFYLRVPPGERRRRATELAGRVGLSDRLDHRPMQLSGGQQQRVCIARSLVNEPIILMADEPTGNLDTKTGQSILALFDQLVEQGKTVIMITHDPSVAERCDRVIRLQDGVILSDVMTNRHRPKAPAIAMEH